jgi:hypothetical protein
MVDNLMKLIHFIPCNKTINGEKTTKLFFHHVFSYHGLPQDIIFNHGPQLTSKFGKGFLNY